ncbi:electron transport complex subunit RsxG [Echinimonas agarilytica]|uniref:Ion-translocating oxidoreductase complex subunit G n=1 Tax=Echinimonas agarilytica TaxID=1215918 RepID=A0AA41W7R5_9GAMM|nr:electron transport complex subunit RsxG [Echinimonas agarilytica]MCM2680450.1 electron transport complex subunit RsxG [Echinimonas agarilytica]
MSVTASKKDNITYSSLLLGLAALAAAALLLIVGAATETTIKTNNRMDQLEGFNQVIASDSYANDLITDVTHIQLDSNSYAVHRAMDNNGKPVGWAIVTHAQGYAGPIKLLIGVDTSNTILGVRVLSHSETPGLGDKIELAKAEWILSFDQQSLSTLTKTQWAVKKDGGSFDQFTGATITPRAIVHQVHTVLTLISQGQLVERENE